MKRAQTIHSRKPATMGDLFREHTLRAIDAARIGRTSPAQNVQIANELLSKAATLLRERLRVGNSDVAIAIVARLGR